MHTHSTRKSKLAPAHISTSGITPGIAVRRAAKRRQAREQLASRVSRPVSQGHAYNNKTPGAGPGKPRPVARSLAYTIIALGIHAGIVLVTMTIHPALPQSPLPKRYVQKMTTTLTTQAKDPRPQPAVRDTEPLSKSKPVAPQVEPQEEKSTPKQKKQRKSKRPSRTETPIPADWVDLPAEKSQTKDSAPRRRVVGISYESTVKAGSGPSFAVGNTRMGKTAATAKDPRTSNKLTKSGSRQPLGRGTSGSANRIATDIPGDAVRIVKPRRLIQVPLDYPKTLKARGIEANVVVRIRIDETGTVTAVRIVKGSGYPEFDAAARRAAGLERFAPAKRNGTPVAYDLKYTYRFRIKAT
ncbi:MAG: energy transducer TonB [Myxococcota bacterium]|nr:energy transducer TonB [Myxococcota bacterium]